MRIKVARFLISLSILLTFLILPILARAESKAGFYPDLAVDIPAMKKTVTFLCNIRPYRNYTHPESLDKVTAYIEAWFREAGLDTHVQPFDVKGET